MWKIVFFLSCFAHFACCQQMTPAPSPRTNLSIGLYWDDCTNSAFWVDYETDDLENCLFRYDWDDDKTYAARIDKYSKPSFILPVGECKNRTDKYLVGSGPNAIIVLWDGVSGVAKYVETVLTAQKGDSTIVMDVARQNLQGHLYGGTIHPTFCQAPHTTTFFKYSNANGYQQIADGLLSTLGLAFDDAKGIIYHDDMCFGIRSYNANCDSNCEATVVFNSTSIGKCFVGLDAATDGKLYTGSYYDPEIWEIDPQSKTGKVIANLDTPGCGGVTFGGPERDVLLVTVGSTIYNEDLTIKEYNNVSSLYKIFNIGKGQPTASLNLN